MSSRWELSSAGLNELLTLVQQEPPLIVQRHVQPSVLPERISGTYALHVISTALL